MKAQHPTFRSDILAVLIAAAVALGAGLLINLFREAPLPLVYRSTEERTMAAVDQMAAAPAEVPVETVPEEVDLDEFRALVADGEAVILDARPAGLHRLGHVPGALSLPLKDFKASYARHRDRLESDKARHIVIYCWGTSCEDSDLVRKALRGLGYTHVSVFRGGWAAWSEAGFPKERNP